mmetsp:Transcript_16275/g.49153  ORF Transcript_16275/g.49153 Transcript_16275/m.49153 type:complete len:278 (+) Transcript_16275:78-911(+)
MPCLSRMLNVHLMGILFADLHDKGLPLEVISCELLRTRFLIVQDDGRDPVPNLMGTNLDLTTEGCLVEGGLVEGCYGDHVLGEGPAETLHEVARLRVADPRGDQEVQDSHTTPVQHLRYPGELTHLVYAEEADRPGKDLGSASALLLIRWAAHSDRANEPREPGVQQVCHRGDRALFHPGLDEDRHRDARRALPALGGGALRQRQGEGRDVRAEGADQEGGAGGPRAARAGASCRGPGVRAGAARCEAGHGGPGGVLDVCADPAHDVGDAAPYVVPG